MKDIRYNISYSKINETKTEMFLKVKVVGKYESRESNNVGFKIWDDSRNGYRNLNYEGIRNMEVAI
tara:strand:- start:1909 stop:2106 length:198 start_codon:yes stop_codon:yes gene_type:complete